MADTTRIVVTFKDEQRASLDEALAVILEKTGYEVKLSDFVRDAVGAKVEALGIPWPAGPKVGGDRSKPTL